MARQKRATHTRQAVIGAAAREFDLAGYEGTSLSRISKVAEISVGALTFHFPTKGELCAAVLSEGGVLTREALRKVVARPEAALDSVIAVTLELARLLERETVVRAAARLSRELPDGDAVWHAVWIPVLERLLRQTAPGEVRPGTDPAVVVTLATHFVIGAEAHVRGRLRAPHVHPGQADERLLGLWRLALIGISGREWKRTRKPCPCADGGHVLPSPPPVRDGPPGEAAPPSAVGRGATVWLTGASESDGAAVARALAGQLTEAGHPVEVVDGSALRDGLAPGTGLAAENLESGIRRVGLLAAVLARNGVKAVVALSVPRHDSRVALRERHALQGSHFLEVHVGGPPAGGSPPAGRDGAPTGSMEESERADGADRPETRYEAHADADLHLPARAQSVEESVAHVLLLLKVHGLY
ncbi:adenylyl-sulfate kinase [Streptomyces sp. MS06]|uniref:adenylyl-sulfate kinase n=1 Tax=Streptomyces sp. MS06 TaxID=3385974 RepID=UPI0039A35D4A